MPPVLQDLGDETALITGATGGIGRATCHALAAQGCNIAVHYHSDADGAKALVDELYKRSVRADMFQADLGEYEEVRRMYREVEGRLGKPSILFCNAGATIKTGVTSAEDVSIEDFEKTWRLNCGSAYLLTQLCLPGMERRQFGRIIYCSSVAAFVGGVIGPHYASSKSALHGLIHWISQTYCKKGITANGVAPALIADTKMFPGNEVAEKNIPMGVPGSPQEIAETVLWMVRVGYVTNKVIGVDGGMYAQG